MFGFILITITTLMQAYIFVRAASVPFVRRYIPRWWLVLTAVVTWAVFLAGRVYGHHGTGPAAVLSEFFGMNWLGAIFLTFTLLLAVDAVTLFGLLFRRSAPHLRGWALAAGIFLSLAALVQGMRPPVVTDYRVDLPGLPAKLDGTVITAVSDMHLGSLLGRKWLSGRLAQIRATNPDMIVFLGDIFEGHGLETDTTARLFRQLHSRLGVWAVAGNHEFYSHGDSGFKQMEQAGFAVLRNEWREIAPGLILAGVDDLSHHQRKNQTDDPVSRALDGRPRDATILLSHSPLEYEKAAALGVGLMLSGHTHNGQIWPFNYLVRLRYPMTAGRYRINGMDLIVCRGTGTWGPRMRLWQPGEILRITLNSGQTP
jgi:hypothetical protein